MIRGPDAGALFGRATDLAQLAALVDVDGALVTILGPPGVGKTRLALELVGAREGDQLVCELAEVRTAEAMLARLAERLHVGSGPESSLVDRVGDALAEREELLVVLDNLEQLVELVAGDLHALRAAAPRTRWLVTSRTAVGLAGEWRYDVAPLSIDGGDSDAARMLADRVTRARGSAPSACERDVLVRIGARLDGLPLALELAASRIAALGASVVEARLEQQLDLLTHGPRNLDPRQRTLRRAIAWSWELLGDDERRALGQLSVFRGSFGLAAAEAVIGHGALDLVHALRDKSLLGTELDDTGAMRFTLYQSIRDFAAGELASEDTHDTDAAHARHASYYAERSDAGPHQLLADRDNVFAAIERCVARASRDSVTIAARLLLGLVALIDRSPLAPYLDRLEAFLATPASAELLAADLRCSLQMTAGRCMRRLGRLRDAKRVYADALALARVIGARGHEARLHSELGMVSFFESHLDDALAHWRTSTAMSRELGDDRRLALDLTRCGMILRESHRLDEARAMLDDGLVIHRREGDADGIVIALTELAQLHFELGDIDRGVALIAEARLVPAANLTLLSEVAIIARTAFGHWERGDYHAGEPFAQRALVHLARIGYRRVEAGLVMYMSIARHLADGARPVSELDWARRQFDNDDRAISLAGSWLAYLAIADSPEHARDMFDALPAMPADDPASVAAAILRLPLDAADADTRARMARELGDTILVDGRAARASSLDVRFALRAVATAPSLAPSTPAGLLEVRADGGVFTLDGSPQSLTRYHTLRRLLLSLVDARLARPGVALAWDELFTAGWPGERAGTEAARNRVKVAVSTLRGMGLRDVLVHDGSGYLIGDAINVRVVRRD